MLWGPLRHVAAQVASPRFPFVAARAHNTRIGLSWGGSHSFSGSITTSIHLQPLSTCDTSLGTNSPPSVRPSSVNTAVGGRSCVSDTSRNTSRNMATTNSLPTESSQAAADERMDVASIQNASGEPPKYLSRLASNFCRTCGSPMELRVPPGEKEWRHVCSSVKCSAVEYFNPKMVVGCVVEHNGKILLCKRAIEPCHGKWTVPAGYMELKESSAEGAARETLEEANAAVEDLVPYAHWDIPAIGQAYILFRGRLAAPYTFSPGVESLETELFTPDSIPFDQLAFSSISITLRYYLEDIAAGRFRIHHGVIQKEPGAASNDPATFSVRDHRAMYVS